MSCVARSRSPLSSSRFRLPPKIRPTARSTPPVQVVAPQQQFVSLSSFTVPPGGSFIVRVRGSGFYGDELTTAPYEMSIKR